MFDLNEYKSYGDLANGILQYSKKAKKVLGQKLYENMLLADLAARKDNENTIKKLAEPSFDEAIISLLGKVPVTSKVMDEIAAKYRRFVFGTQTMRGLDDSIQFSILDRMKALMEDAIDSNILFYDFQKMLMDEQIDYLNQSRLELIFNMNMAQAETHGSWSQIYEQMDADVDLVFKLGAHRHWHDTKEGQDDPCPALDGFVALKSDPVWDGIYPPLHYGCTACTVRVALRADKAVGFSDLPPEVANIQDGFGQSPATGYNIVVPTTGDMNGVISYFEALQ